MVGVASGGVGAAPVSLFFGRRGWESFDSSDPRAIPPNSASGGRWAQRRVSRDTALRQSAVWACLRLRADLISTLPIDVFRKVGGAQVEVPKPPILLTPGGERVDILEWMYSSQVDLDSCGNAFGIITEIDAFNLPRRIDLVAATDVVVTVTKGVVKYRIAGQEYPAEQVWHERQFTMSGLPVGLSPITYAALSLSTDLSAQTFAADWFDAGAAPKGILRNSKRTVEADQADRYRRRFKESVANRDVFVTGNDWEYSMISAKASESSYLEQHNLTSVDVARYLGVPGDLIETQGSTSSITYANITQRHLQLLIMHLNPAVIRREAALSRLTAKPRFVKLNTDALLRMDPLQRSQMLGQQITDRMLAPSEARAFNNLAPFTPEQIDEFAALFPSKAPTPQTGAKT